MNNLNQKTLIIVFLLNFLQTSANAQVQVNPPFAFPDVNVIQVGEKAYAFGGTDLYPYDFELNTFIMPYWRVYLQMTMVESQGWKISFMKTVLASIMQTGRQLKLNGTWIYLMGHQR